MSFGLYLFGFLLVTIGLGYCAALAHVPTHFIAVGAIIMAGLGVLTGVKATRQKDSAQ